jgi:hypothetical protein
MLMRGVTVNESESERERMGNRDEGAGASQLYRLVARTEKKRPQSIALTKQASQQA